MASAPPVKAGGHEAARERREAAKVTHRITAPDVSDLSFDVSANTLSMRTRRRVRHEAGEPVELFLYRGGIGIDTYAHLWWMSRLEAGEPVSLSEAEAEWDDLYGHVGIGDIEEEVVDSGN